MQRKLLVLIFSLTTLLSCNTDNDDNVFQAIITFNFNHNWDGESVTNADFDDIKYTNAHGEQLSIKKLRYLISNITFHKPDGETFVLNGYNLVDVTNDSNLSFAPTTTVPVGDYSKVSFTFGFNNDDNYNGNYTDLNTALWNVPAMMGGGYHFMQLEGKFIDNTATQTSGYAYHVIGAVDNSGATPVFESTFIEVDLGPITITNNATFEIDMNIAEWFKNPNTWDLSALNTFLMANFNAQMMMFQNGQNAFSLNTVNQ
ncbi:MbnP family protein [Flavivirga eckloniae]|uniref:Copper-binding protein MbnP-like domain-containing protein n=1 Tax=Flavivirga eckloniae TaxID=1803846 RepID=A0A2K9PRW8_9FLAO|nr:MbnP family protein [Flavivirga eckloniae]AUP79813.1 hypothetical protein C1H87_14305 [Flavivirga eckloniae]